MKSILQAAFVRAAFTSLILIAASVSTTCYANMEKNTDQIRLDVQSQIRKITPHLNESIFKTYELHFEDEKRISGWASVHSKFITETEELGLCIVSDVFCGNSILSDWANTLASYSNRSSLSILNSVNRSANALGFKTDQFNYGRSDYWATPHQTIQNGGDCEDFALLKYASLMALGFDSNHMRVVVGRTANGSPHSVLTVKIGTKVYVLDSLTSDIGLSDGSSGYIPLYSMNMIDLWAHISPAGN